MMLHHLSLLFSRKLNSFQGVLGNAYSPSFFYESRRPARLGIAMSQECALRSAKWRQSAQFQEFECSRFCMKPSRVGVVVIKDRSVMMRVCSRKFRDYEQAREAK